MAVLTAVSLVAVTVTLLEASVDLLPDQAVLGWFTAGRVALIAGLAALLAQGARARDLRTQLDWVIAALLLAALLSVWRTGFGGAQLRSLLYQIGFFYLTIGCIRRDETNSAITLVALVGAVIAAATGVAQVVQDLPTTFYRDGWASVTSAQPRPDLIVRAVGTFSNPNLLAAFVVLLGPFAVLAVTRTKDAQQRVVLAVAPVVIFGGLVVSFSRAGLFALAVSAAVIVIVVLTASSRWLRYGRYGQAALAVAGSGLSVLLLSGVVGRIAGREEAWRLALRAAGSSPVFGVGLGRAGEVMTAVGEPALPFFHAHNLWLNWLVEAGPVAALAMVLVFVISIRVGVRRALDGSGLALVGLVATAGFVIPSLVDHPANSARIALAFWFALAAIHAPQPRRRPRWRDPAVQDPTRVSAVTARRVASVGASASEPVSGDQRVPTTTRPATP